MRRTTVAVRGTALVMLGVGFLASCADTPSGVVSEEPAVAAPVLAAAPSQALDLKDRYIVVFRDDVRDPAGLTDRLMQGTGATIHFKYTAAIKGFAATVPPQALAALQRNPMISYVEPDGVVTASATQTGATWGLDRIDQRTSSLNGQYSYNATGYGVHAYIIDTGILGTHTEFVGRMVSGFSAFRRGGTTDCNGHGTHVAGTVGGTVYGVAKNVMLVPVRVLDCNGSGTISGVIAGVDWVRANAVRPAVANMSLGGGASSSLDLAIANLVGSGVITVVAAGNENQNACNVSPARAPLAITVGATDSNDLRAGYSNFGSCVDLFAPGTNITSAWYRSTTQTATISGTSMASPHVAGVAALFLTANTGATPAEVEDAIESNATPSVVGNPGAGSPNLLLYSAFASAPAPSEYLLSVTRSGNGSGAIGSNVGGINCGSTCSAMISSGTAVQLTASPASGSTFSGWGGACSGTSLTCTLSMTANMSVSASFSSTTKGGKNR